MTNSPFLKGVKNIKYSFLSQLVILIVGIVKTFIVPNILTIETYAYWQMYLFYISYIGFFYLGYNDGILLKYGKYNYKNLPFQKLRSSMIFYIIMLGLFTVGVLIFGLSMEDLQKAFVVIIIALSIIIMGLNGVLIYVFLITNQIKRYSFFSAVDAVSILVGAILLFLLNQDKYQFLVFFVFFIKLFMVITMCFMCREFFVGKRASLKEGFDEFIDNIRIGSMLMIAQIMSMLITGIGRLIIEYTQTVEEYAYYSFGMTIINVIMIAVVAVSTVMYPMLGRIEQKLLSSYFQKLSVYITDFNVLSLLAYFPAYLLIGLLFPQYSPMLPYLSIFFVMLTWQAKTNIITNSYFRVLRMERKMLLINITGVVFFCFVVLGFMMCKLHLVFDSVYCISVITYLTVAFIEIYAEVKLRYTLGLTFNCILIKDIITNLYFLTIVNIFTIKIGFIGYSGFILLYLLTNFKRIKKDIYNLRFLIK